MGKESPRLLPLQPLLQLFHRHPKAVGADGEGGDFVVGPAQGLGLRGAVAVQPAPDQPGGVAVFQGQVGGQISGRVGPGQGFSILAQAPQDGVGQAGHPAVAVAPGQPDPFVDDGVGGNPLGVRSW